MKRKRRRLTGALPGVTRRGRIFYLQRELPKLGRVYKTLSTRDLSIANSYAGSVQKLIDRGDWDVLARWVEGKLHVAVLERAVREGDWGSLKRLHQSGPLLGEQADRFLDRIGATRRPRTEAVRRSALKLAVEHFGPSRPMHEITQTEAERYLHADRRGRPWSANTQASHCATLSALWAYVMHREREEADLCGVTPWLRFNPWRSAERPRLEQTRFTFFTPAQARALLAHPAVEGTPRAALLGTAIYAGLRRGELANLRTAVDVDLERGGLQIQSRGGDHPWRPKTARGERRVKIVPALRTLLARHLASGFAGERYFFRAEQLDAPPAPSTLDSWTHAAFRAAGVRYGRRHDGLTLHSCRHSFATWLLEHGVAVTIVARLLGDTVDIVLKTYAHHLPGSEDEAMRTLQALVEAAQEAPD